MFVWGRIRYRYMSINHPVDDFLNELIFGHIFLGPRIKGRGGSWDFVRAPGLFCHMDGRNIRVLKRESSITQRSSKVGIVKA